MVEYAVKERGRGKEAGMGDREEHQGSRRKGKGEIIHSIFEARRAVVSDKSGKRRTADRQTIPAEKEDRAGKKKAEHLHSVSWWVSYGGTPVERGKRKKKEEKIQYDKA